MLERTITVVCLTAIVGAHGADATAAPPAARPERSRAALVAQVERMRSERPDRHARLRRAGDRLAIGGHGIEVTLRTPIDVTHRRDGGLELVQFSQVARTWSKLASIWPGEAPRGPLLAGLAPSGRVVYRRLHQHRATFVTVEPGIRGIEEVVDELRRAKHPAGWSLITRGYQMAWPVGFTLRGLDDPGGRPFELKLDGAFEHMIFVAGPLPGERIPHPAAMVAPGMEMVDEGELSGARKRSIIWFELAYVHEGVDWRQRCYYLPAARGWAYFLRAQAPTEKAAEMFRAADEVARSFRVIR